MVRIGGDINGIELEAGDTIDVNGNTWTYQSDGTLSGPALDTDQANIGPQDRDTVTEQSLSIDASNYDSNQAAVDDAESRFSDHAVDITLVDAPSEDLYIPPTVAARLPYGGGSERVPIQLTGDRTTPSNVRLNSVFFDTVIGQSIQLRGVEIQGSNPWDDESVGVTAYGSTEVGLVDVTFAGGTVGAISYGSHMWMGDGVDFGTDVLSADAIKVKHGGRAFDTNGASGNVGGYAFSAAGTGHIIFNSAVSSVTGDSGTVNPGDGFVVDVNDGRFYGLGAVDQTVDWNGNEIRNMGLLRGRESTSQYFNFQNSGDISANVEDGSGGSITALTIKQGTGHTESSQGVHRFGENGARIYLDSNGELWAVDEAGNETQLTTN